jgi:hypothetical protein
LQPWAPDFRKSRKSLSIKVERARQRPGHGPLPTEGIQGTTLKRPYGLLHFNKENLPVIFENIEGFFMRDGNLSSNSGLSLGHKFFAVLLTLAVAGGVYDWFRHNAAQTTSAAEMAFDTRAARRFDPGLATAAEPAVALAQSILTDQVVAGLSKPAFLSSSALMSRVGEFRSRLELTQASPRTLRVQFRDVDSGKAADTANAVASALAAWSPSLTAPPAAVAAPQPQAQPAAPVAAPVPAPVKKPVVTHRERAASGLAASLGELEQQLSSTNRKVDGLSSGGSSRGRSYAQSEQQHLLKGAVREAEKQVADLRVRYADSGAGTKARLGEIQQAVAAILPGGRAVGVDAGQLRRERAELKQAIAVVQKQQQAVTRDEGTSAASSSEESAPAPSPAVQESNLGASSTSAASSAPASPSAAPSSPAASSSSAEPAPIAASAPGDSTLQNPLSVARVAGPAAPIPWWPAAAAGVSCGLLYLIVAALRNRSSGAEVDYVEETPRSSGRFITPDGPSVAAERFESRVESTPVESAPAAGGPFRRAAFSYEPPPAGAAPEERPEPVVIEEASVGETQEMASPPEEVVSSPVKVVDIGDPWDSWADGMKQALSETRIGRMFEVPAEREESTGTNQEDRGSRSSRPDRLAG